MKIFIFTLDDNNATRFIDKRQSLDKNVADRILLLSTPHPIWIKKTSESFFDDADFKPEFIYFKSFNDIEDNNLNLILEMLKRPIDLIEMRKTKIKENIRKFLSFI